MSYATPSEASAPLGVTGFSPGTNSVPSSSQIQAWLDLNSIDLNCCLTTIGYVIPTDSTTNGYKLLIEMNRLFVGAQIGFALSAGRVEENHTGLYLKNLYDEMMDRLKNGYYAGIFDPDDSTNPFSGSINMPDPHITWSTIW